MQKIGLSLQSKYALPMADVLRLLRTVGFDAVSPIWQQDISLDALVRTAHGCGLALQSLHGPLRGLPGMWSREESCAAPILQALLCAAEACAAYDIPVLVVHPWNGLDYTFQESALYFDNFDRLVEYAHNHGIQIAFENLEGPEFLQALMTRYQDCPAVGFCWDSGHAHCYTPDQDSLTAYGDRLLMTHLNDNYGITGSDGKPQGTDDLHLLPFDGNLDWDRNICRLRHAKPQNILNFELKIRPKGDRCKTDLYSHLPLERYFALAYERASRVASQYFNSNVFPSFRVDSSGR